MDIKDKDFVCNGFVKCTGRTFDPFDDTCQDCSDRKLQELICTPSLQMENEKLNDPCKKRQILTSDEKFTENNHV